MIGRVVLLVALTTLPLGAEVYPALHDVTGVAEGDVLNIRAAPEAGAQVIGTLAPEAKGVEVISTRDGWGLVNSGEESGYAAMRYLTRSPGPDWMALQRPLTCRGTEPFWSLQIDPVAGETRFTTPEDPVGRSTPIRESWPGNPAFPTAAVPLPEGLAVLTPAACSDGMSDQSYGIAVDILLTGTAGGRLSGCCSLSPP